MSHPVFASPLSWPVVSRGFQWFPFQWFPVVSPLGRGSSAGAGASSLWPTFSGGLGRYHGSTGITCLRRLWPLLVLPSSLYLVGEATPPWPFCALAGVCLARWAVGVVFPILHSCMHPRANFFSTASVSSRVALSAPRVRSDETSDSQQWKG